MQKERFLDLRRRQRLEHQAAVNTHMALHLIRWTVLTMALDGPYDDPCAQALETLDQRRAVGEAMTAKSRAFVQETGIVVAAG